MKDEHDRNDEVSSKRKSDDSVDRKRVDFPRRAHREEYGAEVAPPTSYRREEVKRKDAVPVKHEADRIAESSGKVSGYVGLACGIASLFMWSIVLGPAAAVLGYYAYANGHKTSGAWSMGLGIVATLSYFFMIPFAR